MEFACGTGSPSARWPLDDRGLSIEPLLECLEALAEDVNVIEKRLSEGKRVLGVIASYGFSRVMGALISSNPKRARPFGKHAVDEALALHLFQAQG